MLSDAHTHLRGKLKGVLKRAKDNNVFIILTAGSTLQSSIQAVEIAKKHDTVYACTGIHPWNASDFNEEAYRKLRDLLHEVDVVAVSEIGLDFRGRRKPDGEYTTEYIPKKIQVETFQRQIQ